MIETTFPHKNSCLRSIADLDRGQIANCYDYTDTRLYAAFLLLTVALKCLERVSACFNSIYLRIASYRLNSKPSLHSPVETQSYRFLLHIPAYALYLKTIEQNRLHIGLLNGIFLVSKPVPLASILLKSLASEIGSYVWLIVHTSHKSASTS